MEPNYIEIGRNIHMYRQLRGLKQRELAELIHVSDQHISHIETAHTKLSLVTLISIANALHIDCNTLLGTSLSEAKEIILYQQLSNLVSQLDTRKLGLATEFCKMLVLYDLDQ